MNSHSERGSLRVATALVIGLLSAGTARACDDLRADKAICSTHLLLLWDALNNYRKAHKELPAKLSDLHPQFLTDPEILFCPVARRKGKTILEISRGSEYEDDDTATSYSFEFSLKAIKEFAPKTMRDWKERQMGKIGARIPIVRCHLHGEQRLDLTFAGTIEESGENWEDKFEDVIDTENLDDEYFFSVNEAPQAPRIAAPARPGRPVPRVIIIPPRDPKLLGDKSAVDLSKHYNASTSKAWDGQFANNDLNQLKLGPTVFGGITFDVRGLIQLASKSRLADLFKPEVRGIKVDASCQKLHLLHGCSHGSDDQVGKTIGKIIVHLRDGSVEEREITYGEQVLDWWHSPKAIFNQAENTEVAWTGNNGSTEKELRLYLTTFDLAADSFVDSIDFLSTGDRAAPFVVAISISG